MCCGSRDGELYMSDEMFGYVPGIFKNTKNLKALIQVSGKQFDKVDDLIQDITDQLYVDSATWGLVDWENEYGMEPNPTLTYDERRSRIKAKIRGIGKVDANLIRSVTQAYADGSVEVDFNGSIVITFIGRRGIPSAIEELKKQLSEIVPAHLNIVYVFTYLTWFEFDSLTAAEQESMTWNELEVYRPSEGG